MLDDTILIGTRRYNIDKKGRIPLTIFNAEEGEQVILVAEDDSIDIYSNKYVNELNQKATESLNPVDIDLRDHIVANAIGIAIIDKNHRVLIPSVLVRQYGIRDQVIVTGKIDKISIYSEEDYNNYIKSTGSIKTKVLTNKNC